MLTYQLQPETTEEDKQHISDNFDKMKIPHFFTNSNLLTFTRPEDIAPSVLFKMGVFIGMREANVIVRPKV